MSKKGKELIAKCLSEIKQKNGGCVNMAEVAEMLAEMVVVNENDLSHIVMPRISHFEDDKGVIHGAANDSEIKHEFTDEGVLQWYVDYTERVYLTPVKYEA